MSRFVGRANVRKRLGPLDGLPGHTTYSNGVVRLEMDEETVVARPPFGLSHVGEYPNVHLGPFFDALDQDHVVAVLLVRLGGYAVGVYEGERLVASKVGARFVKNRHKKGGSSANRFRRRREEQARGLVREAAEVAVDVLEPWRDQIDFVAIGGHRQTVEEVLGVTPELSWLRDSALPRFFSVAEPRRAVLERLPYDLYSAELSVE